MPGSTRLPGPLEDDELLDDELLEEELLLDDELLDDELLGGGTHGGTTSFWIWLFSGSTSWFFCGAPCTPAP